MPFVLIALAAACSSQSPGEHLASTREAIINGTPVPSSNTSGYVKVNTPKAVCSGIMLSPDWALTAQHCQLDTLIPSHNLVTMGSEGGPQETARGVFAVGHPSLDYALVQLDHRLDVPADNRGIFTLGPSALKGLTLTGFGYSFGQCSANGGTGPDDTCQHSCDSPDDCVGFGVLRSANFIASGYYDEYNFNMTNNAVGQPQFTVAGDSGSPLMLLAPSGPVLTGVLKSGPYGNTPNFRDWVLSYMFDRPVPLPDVWNLNKPPPQFLQAHPLQDNFSNTATWNPCPWLDYTWSATYSLDPADTISLTTSSSATTFSPSATSVAGTGRGELTLSIATGTQATPAAGLQTLAVTCEHDAVRYAPPLSANSDSWDPCSGAPYIAHLTYGVPPGATLTANGQSFSQGGTQQFQTRGPMSLAWGPSTDGAAYIDSLTATCTDASFGTPNGTPVLRCLGPECVTLGGVAQVPPLTATPTTWAPCGDGAFKWSFKGGINSAFVSITGADGTAVLLGPQNNGASFTAGWVHSTGPLQVTIGSGFATGQVNVEALSAVCNDWNTVPASGIHVALGTYGADCGANPGNKTYDLAGFCDGQSQCEYPVSYQVIGDPFPGCAKDYTASWTCDDDVTVHTTEIAPEAGFGSMAKLVCPSGQAQPPPACLAQCLSQFLSCVRTNPRSLSFCLSEENACDQACVPCQPTTCPAQGARCGTIPDGCGNTLTCGSCSSNLTCVSNECVCIPTTCAIQNAACGSIPDGCGGTIDCGGCSAGDACNPQNQCVCAPKTSCDGLCGVVSDGCGGTLSCPGTPNCPSDARCGDGDGCGGRCKGSCPKVGDVCGDQGFGPVCIPGP